MKQSGLHWCCFYNFSYHNLETGLNQSCSNMSLMYSFDEAWILLQIFISFFFEETKLVGNDADLGVMEVRRIQWKYIKNAIRIFLNW